MKWKQGHFHQKKTGIQTTSEWVSSAVRKHTQKYAIQTRQKMTKQKKKNVEKRWRDKERDNNRKELRWKYKSETQRRKSYVLIRRNNSICAHPLFSLQESYGITPLPDAPPPISSGAPLRFYRARTVSTCMYINITRVPWKYICGTWLPAHASTRPWSGKAAWPELKYHFHSVHESVSSAHRPPLDLKLVRPSKNQVLLEEWASADSTGGRVQEERPLRQ